jgi:hypothetical protein
MNTFEILTSKFRLHWNVSISPEKWPIFCRFLTLFPLKRPSRREKNIFNMGATIPVLFGIIEGKFGWLQDYFQNFIIFLIIRMEY